MRRLVARLRKPRRRYGPEDFEQTIMILRFDEWAGCYL